MSDDKSTDNIARGMAIVSLLVAIASVAVPYISSKFCRMRSWPLI